MPDIYPAGVQESHEKLQATTRRVVVFTLKHKYARLLFVLFILIANPVQAEHDFVVLAQQMLIGTDQQRNAAADAIIERGGVDMVPTLVLLMRIGGSHVATQRALQALTGETLRTWREAMLYQEAHPEFKPHSSYYELKLWYWSGIDKDFLSLFSNAADQSKLRIRFEEITWGGALYDGCLLYTSPSPRDLSTSRMPSSA